MISDKFGLIDEYNNYYFISLINAINSVVGGEKLRIYGLIDKVSSCAGDPEGKYLDDFSDDVKEQSGILFKTDKEKHLISRVDSPVPLCLSETERIYLKAVLHSKYSRLFLSENEISFLDSSLEDVPYLPLDEYIISSYSRERSFFEEQADKLKLLLSAIRGEREILYSNKARNMDHKNRHGYPVKIEYSLMYDILQLSLWSSDENRPVKLNIHSMYDIRETANIWNEKKSPAEMLEAKRCREPLIAEIFQDNNSVERANKLFSMYDTKITENKGKFLLEIRYYKYEEEELIRNLISFGPYIKVISPGETVDSFKEQLRKLLENQL